MWRAPVPVPSGKGQAPKAKVALAPVPARSGKGQAPKAKVDCKWLGTWARWAPCGRAKGETVAMAGGRNRAHGEAAMQVVRRMGAVGAMRSD